MGQGFRALRSFQPAHWKPPCSGCVRAMDRHARAFAWNHAAGDSIFAPKKSCELSLELYTPLYDAKTALSSLVRVKRTAHVVNHARRFWRCNCYGRRPQLEA